MGTLWPRGHEVWGSVAPARLSGNGTAWPVLCSLHSYPGCISPSLALQKGPLIFLSSVCRTAMALSSNTALVPLGLKCQYPGCPLWTLVCQPAEGPRHLQEHCPLPSALCWTRQVRLGVAVKKGRLGTMPRFTSKNCVCYTAVSVPTVQGDCLRHLLSPVCPLPGFKCGLPGE